MALNLAFEGRQYPSREPYLVGREKIREFADAIGATDAAYRDPAAARELGHPDVIAPPTFPMVITMPASEEITGDPDLGLDYSRVVHGDQRFAFVRPLRAGDEISWVTHIEKLSSRAGLDSVSLRIEMATTDGEPVATGWTRLIARGEG
jgi:acyl dehydratase